MLGEFLLHQHHPEDDVEEDQPERHVKDTVVPGAGVHCPSQHGRHEDRYGHAHTHKPHRLADGFMAHRVGQKRQADGPDDGGGDALQEAADDEESEGGAEAEEEGRAEEGEQADHEREASGGCVVG